MTTLMLDNVYRLSGGVPVFQSTPAPTTEQLQALLTRIITRLMKVLTRKGFPIAEQGTSYLGYTDRDTALTPLHSATCTYRMALGPRAAQKVLTLRNHSLAVPGHKAQHAPCGCVSRHGFSLHAEVRCATQQRHTLERLCRDITRPAIANTWLTRMRADNVVQDAVP